MIVLVGASASGKTELAKNLYKTFGYTKCITTTTREPRVGEINDIDYHFLSLETFELLKSKHEFLEVSLYNGNYYGVQKKDVKQKGVVVVDPNGANSILEQAFDDVFVVYVESSEVTRKTRMLNRGDDPILVEKRLTNDAKVFHHQSIHRIDLLINNEDQHINELAEKIHKAYSDFLKES